MSQCSQRGQMSQVAACVLAISSHIKKKQDKNPITGGGGVMQICITLYIFFNTVKAQICTHSKLFDF